VTTRAARVECKVKADRCMAERLNDLVQLWIEMNGAQFPLDVIRKMIIAHALRELHSDLRHPELKADLAGKFQQIQERMQPLK
jgi:hypothetical protein